MPECNDLLNKMLDHDPKQRLKYYLFILFLFVLLLK